MTRKKRSRLRPYALLASVTTCVLVACSVDTSAIHFVPDDLFGSVGEGGEPPSGGGSQDSGGTSTGEGGEPTGAPSAGMSNVGAGGQGGGTASQGGAGPQGGQPVGGAPQGGQAMGGAGQGGQPVGGMGGGGEMAGYPCDALDAAPLIADFNTLNSPSDTWLIQGVVLSLYVAPPNSFAKLGNGNLTLENNAGIATAVGIRMARCMNATSYGGISFAANGTTFDGKPLTIRVAAVTNADLPVDPTRRLGACVPPNGVDAMTFCRPPSTEITLPQGPLMRMTIPFTSFDNGNPAQRVKPSEIVGIEFAYFTNSPTPPPKGTMTIDDLRFE